VLLYIEQRTLYRNSNSGNWFSALNNGVYRHPVKGFLCPSDPTLEGDGVVHLGGDTWGASSHAVNAQVFCKVLGPTYGLPARYWVESAQGDRRYPQEIPDGCSQTILIAEKYAHCTDGGREGGTLWAYSDLGPNAMYMQAAFAASWSPYTIGPSSRFQVKPPRDKCDPWLASTPHNSMNVAMADGSVRTLSASMSGETWWAACTPDTCDIPGNDW
jgi:prepilin-type processing-associated H-X9-DG protein